MLEYGKISLDRQICGWEWYKDGSTMRLFIHCLLQANYEECSFRGTVIKRGQFVTSLNSLCDQTGMCRAAIVRALDNLESTGEIERHSPGNRYTVVTVRNYEAYQSGLHSKKQTAKQTGKQTAIQTAKQTQCNNIINVNENNINSSASSDKIEVVRKPMRR